jgi:hypothetical protein
MNNLGCVYERYGRLGRAQQIYWRGWKLSREIAGPRHRLTRDYAFARQMELLQKESSMHANNNDNDLQCEMSRYVYLLFDEEVVRLQGLFGY